MKKAFLILLILLVFGLLYAYIQKQESEKQQAIERMKQIETQKNKSVERRQEIEKVID